MIHQIILTFAIGIFAGFIGAIAGSGGLVSIPFMMFIGLPPHIAIATNKLGAVGLSIGAIYNFWKEKRIIWKYVLPFSFISLVAGLIGAKLLLDINKESLNIAVGFIILLLLPLIFIKKDIGIKNRKTSILKKSIGLFLYFLILIFGGFFGGGCGTLIFFCLMYFMGFTIIEANATDIIPWFLLSLSSLILFMVKGMVDYYIGVALFFGMLAGGYFGARAAIKKGNRWVKVVFAVVVIASSIRILFFN